MTDAGGGVMTPDSFVVHIYRKPDSSPREAVGVVERVGGSGRQAFKDANELWALLFGSGRQIPVRKRKG